MREVGHEARLLFVLLWTIVDDSGRCHGDPDLLAEVLYPQESDVPTHIQLWLDELEQQGCIKRYEYEDIDYLPAPPREQIAGERRQRC